MNDAPSSNPNGRDWLAVGACLALFVGWSLYADKHAPKNAAPVPEAAPAASATVTPSAAPAPAVLASAKAAKPTVPEQVDALENDQVRATFTSHGAGIAAIDLKKHAVSKGALPLVLNEGKVLGQAAPPIFSLTGWDDADGTAPWEVRKGENSLVYSRTLANGVRVERAYSLGAGYRIDLVQTLTNPSGQAVVLPEALLQVGTAQSLYSNDQAASVAADWMTIDGKFQNISANQFAQSNGVLGLFGAHPARDAIASPSPSAPIIWAAVKDRFFTVVVAPPSDRAIEAIVAKPASGGGLLSGIAASARFPALTLQPSEVRAEKYALYAGPKEHAALKALGGGEEKIMQYGWWGWVAVPLAGAMEWIYRYVPNYGWSIILLTVALKFVFWPLQSAANRSMKQMQALAPRQKELSAKYKEDPQRMQVETMKLYKEYGVNPVGGCLPMLIQFPIFIGFYTMLQNAGQFQHQSWLWVHDLVQPDTVGHIFGFPINPLPVLSALTQYGIMRLSPQASDNPQMKVMQWMPLVMLAILYNFAAALSLYWTVNNLISMVQTYRNMHKPVPTLHKVKKAKQAPFKGLGSSFKKR